MANGARVLLHQDLSKLYSSPRQIKGDEPAGAMLALSLHCLMVRQGFISIHGSWRRPMQPESNWNGRQKEEGFASWVFEYKRQGYSNAFVLHCSLQAASGKVFVHAREVDNDSNVHMLGLLVSRYIPDAARCQEPSWDGVIDNSEQLESQFLEFIVQPLLEASEASPMQDQSRWSLQDAYKAYLPDRQVGIMLAAAGIAAVLVGVIIIQQRRRQ